MNIVNNSLVIEMDLDNDVWNRVIKATEGYDDISLKINNANIKISKLPIPKSISSMEFESCNFSVAVEVSGLDKGRYFRIVNCTKSFILGNITLKNICCRTFVFKDNLPKKKDDEYSISNMKISPSIKGCVFHNFDYCSVSCPELMNVIFIDKFKFTSLLDNEPMSFFFGRCKFLAGLRIEVLGVNELNLIIKESLVTDLDEYGNIFSELPYSSGLVSFDVSKKTVIKEIKITDSNLIGFNLYLFKKRIENVDIENSTLGVLDLYTASDDEDNYIYNVNIIESVIEKLNLRYRNIVHEMSLYNTTFNSPPDLLGANIPNGCVFPRREFFKSRKGTHDASCYRNIRFSMESQRDRELEGMFFFLEQESIMNIKEGLSKYLSLSYLYYIFSDYGTNYTRPFLTLSISVILFTITNSLLLSPVISLNSPIDWELILTSFLLTVKQVLQPFSTLKEISLNTQDVGTINYLYVILGVINSSISIGCLTLSALAIRWKFKRG